ncbi:MAG: dihydroorotase [Ilumatobacteraceae bacterium]
MTIVIKGGRVLSPSGAVDADVLVDGDRVVDVGRGLRGDETLDASGCHVFPGFVDLHTHLREPGREEAETIETGSRAGALGGYTALVAMPNTNPAQDSVAVVQFVRDQGRRAGLCEVFPSGCITVAREGKVLAPFADLSRAGVRVFTDDGNGVQDPAVMRRALEYGKSLGVTMAQHCEVQDLTKNAVMDECACSSDLGLPGWPALAEEMMLARDIELCRLTGGCLHVLHVSTRGSVELVRKAKYDGLPVTAEVTPHHLSLDHESLRTFDPVFKVNPPLRSVDDVSALREGLLDGTIDAVATDHAPHPPRDKELPLDQAPPGMLGLEYAFGVVNSVVDLSPERVAQVFAINPARIAQIDDRHGSWVAAGRWANLTVVDLDVQWRAEEHRSASLSRNIPYRGRVLRGRVRHTILYGRAVVRDGEAQR